VQRVLGIPIKVSKLMFVLVNKSGILQDACKQCLKELRLERKMIDSIMYIDQLFQGIDFEELKNSH